MSTRCTVHFHYRDNQEPEAIVYRHSDGYPNSQHGVPASLERFFTDVETQTKDTRFNDPTYLAAKYVVWQANEYSGDEMLDFLSVGVMQSDPGDIEYRYHIWCNSDKPNVTWEKV